MSWSEPDPGQGDPAGIDALARELGEVARAASSAQSQLRQLHDNASDAIWRGTSADAFRDRIAKLPGHLAKLASSYQDAADGFTGYSAAVRQIAHDATLARTEVSAAQDGVSSTARQRAGYVAPAGSPPAPNPYDQAVADAKSRLSNAAGKLTHLADDRRVRQQSAGRADAGPPRRDEEQVVVAQALTVVSKALAVVTIVLLALAVAAVILVAFIAPALIPALLVLAGQALTALSAAQLGVDGTRMALGQEVSWTGLGLDALGCLPIVGALAETLGAGEKLAAVATQVAPALTKGAKYVRAGTRAVHAAHAGAGAFVKSLATDLKAVRVGVSVTPDGTRVIVGDGKGAGQMLTDARDAALAAKSYDRPPSLRGATKQEARDAVPDHYEGPKPLKKGSGERYLDPRRRGDGIYIEDGHPEHADPLHRGPYVKVSHSGSVERIPLDGTRRWRARRRRDQIPRREAHPLGRDRGLRRILGTRMGAEQRRGSGAKPRTSSTSCCRTSRSAVDRGVSVRLAEGAGGGCPPD